MGEDQYDAELDAPAPDDLDIGVEAAPVVVMSATFPARPSSIPEIRDFVRRSLEDAPLDAAANREVQEAVGEALIEAAGHEGAAIVVSFRIYLDQVEVDVLHTATDREEGPRATRPEEVSFAEWMGTVLKREHMSQEAAARALGVSVRTVWRWVSGETEPRLRDLRRIHEVFGGSPLNG